MRRIAWLVAVVAFLAVACGDSGSGDGGELSEAEQELAEVISDSVEEDGVITGAEADCVGEEAVRELGVEGLVEIGISVEQSGVFDDPTEEQLDAMVDVMVECVDIADLIVQEALADASISEESARCLGDELNDPELLKPLMRLGLSGGDPGEVFAADEETAERLFGAFLECLSFEELESLGS